MLPYVHDALGDMLRARDELNAVLDGVADDDWERYVPFGSRTLHDVLAHMAGADQVWALAAQGLLKAEGGGGRPLMTSTDAAAARGRAIVRGRSMSVGELREEMERRRRLLISLYGLLEKRHLALALPSLGEQHNSVRERIWRGYHDRLHADDVRRALSMNWYPQRLNLPPELSAAIAGLAPNETLYVVYSVDPTRWEMPSSNSGWTNRELLAHIATGDWIFASKLRSIIENVEPAFIGVEEGNAERVAARRFSTVRALVDEYLSMRHETMRLLGQLTEKHLRVTVELPWLPGERRTVLEMINGFPQHEQIHREALRPAMLYATSMR